MEQYRTKGGRSYGDCGEKGFAEGPVWELLCGILCHEEIVDDRQCGNVSCIQSNTQ